MSFQIEQKVSILKSYIFIFKNIPLHVSTDRMYYSLPVRETKGYKKRLFYTPLDGASK